MTFEEYSNLRARDSFGQIRRKVVVERPQLVRFRGKVWQVIDLMGDNVMLVASIQRHQKHLVHEIELDI